MQRSGLGLDNIMQDVVHPMALEFSLDPEKALREASMRYDKTIPEPLILERDYLLSALEKMKKASPEIIEAFSKARENIEKFHKAQIPNSFSMNVGKNQLEYRYTPFRRVALYVPGGKALYPSTVLMGIIPAMLAKVEQILLISPPSQTGVVSDVVCAIAGMAGASSILQAGGAQAILAGAYGLPSFGIEPADYIYGPGNIYVAAAKNYVAQKNLCGIDSFAGPSEVLIIADHRANPDWLAHDLLAQAEHDEKASAILLVTDSKVAQQTLEMIEKAISKRKERSHIAREAMEKNGHIFLVDSLGEAIAFSNDYAPEHLEVQTADPEKVAEKITAAGSIFLGDYAPVAAGDYFTGTNHILPTSGAARFASGVSVQSFYKRITVQNVSPQGLKEASGPIEVMSKVEGLFDEHGWSVLARFAQESQCQEPQ